MKPIRISQILVKYNFILYNQVPSAFLNKKTNNMKTKGSLFIFYLKIRIDEVLRLKIYSFFDYFLEYHQVAMIKANKNKKTFEQNRDLLSSKKDHLKP